MPGSQKWMGYWTERLDKLVDGGDEAKHLNVPVAVIDAIVKAADLERTDDCR